MEKTAAEPVPGHLRNAVTPLMKQAGYGAGYQYAHDLEEKVAAMQCLPESLRDRVYYRPTNQGVEKRIAERLEQIRQISRQKTDSSRHKGEGRITKDGG